MNERDKAVIEEIRTDACYDNLCFILELIGEENTIKILDNFGGSWLSLPSRKTVEMNYRNKQIKEHFNKTHNYKMTSRCFNITENRVRQIIKLEPVKK